MIGETMDFDAFEHIVFSRATRRRSWEIFERDIVKWWMVNESTLQIERYWAWDEWPDKERHQYAFKDIGIDGVAVTRNGERWAVQAKYSDDPDKQLPWSELATFFGHAARPVRRVFDRRVIVTNTWAPNATLKSVLDANPDTCWFGRDALRSSPVDWAACLDARKALRPVPKKPRPHQQQALAAIVSALARGGRAQVHMPCGSGKTLVALWAVERLAVRRALVLVPTLSLVKQLLNDWMLNRSSDFEFLTVCSDQTVSTSDSLVEVASELGLTTTTDPKVIARFLESKSKSPKIIFSTYQSSPRIAEALTRSRAVKFDLAICDEAHKTVGVRQGPFATILDDAKIPALRRLFLTATPRIYGANLKAKSEDQGWTLRSMDDERVYGPVVYRLSFGDAIKNGLLCDYRVVVMMVSDAEIRSAIRERALIRVEAGIVDAESLAGHIALGKALKRYKLRKVITFHQRIAAARTFADPTADLSLPSLLDKLRLRPKDLWTGHVSGEMSAGRRSQLLHEFTSHEGVAIIANARCLTEGIDVPSADSVVFIDPRQSKIDIVQALGRVIRNTPNKTIGTIVVPLVFNKGESPDELFASSRFAAIGDVLRALRAHDERLSDALDHYRLAIGERKATAKGFLGTHVLVDIPSNLDANVLAEAINLRLVKLSSRGAWEYVGALKRYVAKYGWSRFTAQTKFENLALGTWASERRAEYRRGKLEKPLAEALQSIGGWSWDPLSDWWEEGFAHLLAYVKLHGDALVPFAETTKSGFKIGIWVTTQRRKCSQMTPERRNRLEELPGWTWKGRTGKWEVGFDHLQQFVRERRHARVPSDYVTENGFALGSWVITQRYRMKLDPERRARLEALPGWVWNPFEAKWEAGFEHLRAYVKKFGTAHVSQSRLNEAGFPVGRWVSKQRANRERLPANRKRQLEALRGWTWNARPPD